MRASAAILLFVSFTAPAFAYRVISPGPSAGWNTSGPQTLTWERVGTDPLNFTAVLVNQVNSPPSSQILAALVDGTLLKTAVSPPSGGWPSGNGFQVNLVQDQNTLTSILAQSEKFNINASAVTGTPTSQFATGTSTIGDSFNPTADSNAPASNAAISTFQMQSSLGFVGILGVLAAFLN
jgi:hypothetical protein